MFYERLTENVEEASLEESEEIFKALNALSEDDLKIVATKRFVIKEE